MYINITIIITTIIIVIVIIAIIIMPASWASASPRTRPNIIIGYYWMY